MRDKLINFGLSYGLVTGCIFPMYVFDIDSIGYFLLMCLWYALLWASLSIRNDLDSAKTQLYGLREREKQLHRLLECIESLEDDELKEWFHGRLYPHGSV